MKSNKLNLRTRFAVSIVLLFASQLCSFTQVCAWDTQVMTIVFSFSKNVTTEKMEYIPLWLESQSHTETARAVIVDMLIEVRREVTQINSSGNVDVVRRLPHYCKRTVDRLEDYYERCQELVRADLLIVSHSLW